MKHRTLAAAAGAATLVLSVAAAPSTASPAASPAASPVASPSAAVGDYAGACTGADATTGTTVVIDFQELDGNGGTAAPDLVRCSPDPDPSTPRTALQALQESGITPTGVQRWGLAFVCRIDGRPSATESIPLAGNPTYREACVNTPPASAHWSSWWADGTTTSWTYSTSGATSRNAVPGGFEGWSFSLNRTATTNPPPGRSPRNPALSAPAVSLTVGDPDGAIMLGDSTTLTWTSSRTRSRTASVTPAAGAGGWTGGKAVSGRKTLKPIKRGTFTYTLVGAGAGGRSATATATLTVR